MSYITVDTQYVMDNLGAMPLVDVRPINMYDEGHIPGALAVPLDLIEKEDTEGLGPCLAHHFKVLGIHEHTPVIVYCETGYHAKIVCDALDAEGYTELRYYEGSFDAWKADPDRPVEEA